MNHEMKVRLAQQLGEAAKYREKGDELSAEFLEDGVFSYCLANWSVEIFKEEGKQWGVDRYEGNGRCRSL